MIRSTELYHRERRLNKQKKELYKRLKNRFSNHKLKPHQRQLAIQEYTQWLESLTSKTKKDHVVIMEEGKPYIYGLEENKVLSWEKGAFKETNFLNLLSWS